MNTLFDFKDYTPTPLGDSGRAATYRPYYTEKNAIMCKPLFDKLLADQNSCTVNAKQINCTPGSLHQKLLYGIRWLCDHDHERQKYAILRAQITFRRTGIGVDILFHKDNEYRNIVNISADPLASEDRKANWFEIFNSWLSKANELEVFDSMQIFGGVVAITPEDEMALVKVCAQTGSELDCNREQGKFKVMR